MFISAGHSQISRHCFWTRDDKFLLETLNKKLKLFVLLLRVFWFAVSGRDGAGQHFCSPELKRNRSAHLR